MTNEYVLNEAQGLEDKEASVLVELNSKLYLELLVLRLKTNALELAATHNKSEHNATIEKLQKTQRELSNRKLDVKDVSDRRDELTETNRLLNNEMRNLRTAVNGEEVRWQEEVTRLKKELKAVHAQKKAAFEERNEAQDDLADIRYTLTSLVDGKKED